MHSLCYTCFAHQSLCLLTILVLNIVFLYMGYRQLKREAQGAQHGSAGAGQFRHNTAAIPGKSETLPWPVACTVILHKLLTLQSCHTVLRLCDGLEVTSTAFASC